jgi:hypothetical protein
VEINSPVDKYAPVTNFNSKYDELIKTHMLQTQFEESNSQRDNTIFANGKI